MSEQLNQQQIAEYKEAFSLVDKDADGYVDLQELSLLIRGLNQYPSNRQLSQYLKEADPEGRGKVQFAQFLALMVKIYRQTQPQEMLISAIDVLCNKPKASTDQKSLNLLELKHKIRYDGEPLIQQEQDQLSEFITSYKLLTNSNEIKLADFTRLLANLHRN